jgi:3'(2'), 5'-bisphosphate nucleotidase
MSLFRNCAVIKAMVPVLKEAGHIAKEYRRRADGDFEIMIKPDNTKVTGGDLAVHNFLARAIPKITPDIPVASEEDTASLQNFGNKPYWVLDPIDGTNNFINGRKVNSDDYAILAAIVEKGMPRLGLVYGPQSDTLYMAAKGTGAFKIAPPQEHPKAIERITSKLISSVVIESLWPRTQKPSVNTTQLKTRTWQEGDTIRIGTNHYLDESPYKDMLRKAFEAARYCPKFIKFEPTISRICGVAEGVVDVYAFGLKTPAGEWDVASAHIILDEAGGGFVRLDKPHEAVTYGNPTRGVANVLAVSDPRAMRHVLSLVS